MTPVVLSTLLALGAAALAAGRMDGVAATGVWLGALLGSALGVIGVLWVRHALRYRPERAFRAQIEAFLAKIAALFVFTVAFRFAEPLARIADWQAFAVAFVGAALFVAVGGIAAVMLRRGSSSREAKPA